MGKRLSPTVEVVFPCLDEAAALPDVLQRVPDCYRAIVVDNGSTDRSAAIAARCGALVVEEPRRGYGSAVHAGLLAATAEIVAVMDCDGSLDPRQLVGLVEDVASGRAQLAVARRVPTARSSWPWHARAGNRVLAHYLSRRTALDLRDLGPVRVATRTGLLDLGVQDRRSGYPVETLLRAAEAGWRITEHDMDYAPRAAGTRSKVSGSVGGTVTALRDIAGVIAREGRRRTQPGDNGWTPDLRPTAS